MHGWVATGQDDCRQSGRHTQGGGVIVLTSFLPLLSLLRAHHVGLAPPYKIPRGSGSARRSCLLPWNSQPDSGTLVHWAIFQGIRSRLCHICPWSICPLPAFEQIHPDSIEDFSQMAMGICSAGPRVAQRTTAPPRRRRSDPIPHFNALPL